MLSVEDARRFHDEVLVTDLHADTPKLMERLGLDLGARHEPWPRWLSYVGHVDLPRLRAGGVAAQVFGLWTFPFPRRGCAASVVRQIDALDRAAAAHPGEIVWARGRGDVARARAAGAVAMLAGVEGGQALEGDLGNVARFAARGVRAIGLLHFSRNELGCPAYGQGADPRRGLTGFGREVIREMNRCGVVVDLAHLNRAGFFDALEEARAPVMVSHTGVSGVHPHWRNVDDEQLRSVADNGGCVGVIFARRFLGGGGDLEAVCAHLAHIIDVAGEDVPALGSDFDGFVVPPAGLEDVSRLPALTAALAGRGLGTRRLAKILGENALRVLDA